MWWYHLHIRVYPYGGSKCPMCFAEGMGIWICLNCSVDPTIRHFNSSWTCYQTCKIAGCAGNAGNGFRTTDFKGKPLVGGPGMQHRTCVTHVSWCMSGSLTCGGGENVPSIPGACVTRNFAYLVRGPWTKGREMHICVSKQSHHWFR